MNRQALEYQVAHFILVKAYRDASAVLFKRTRKDKPDTDTIESFLDIAYYQGLSNRGSRRAFMVLISSPVVFDLEVS